MCKYCTLRRYKDGSIRSMKTWRGGRFSDAIISYVPDQSEYYGSPFALLIESGLPWQFVDTGIMYCPWCGKELKPPKGAKD